MHQKRRVALVSGGARGIGLACGTALARMGFDIAFCYRRNAEAAAAAIAAVEAENQAAYASCIDVTDSRAVRDWVDSVEATAGEVHVAVTAAGITRDSPLVMLTHAQWDEVIRTNLDGVYNVTKAVAYPMVQRRRGSVINISSICGVYGHGSQSNYSASKAGVIAFSRSVAKEVGRYGVRINSVTPGFIDTDMTAALSAPVRQKLLDGVPVGRAGRPEEVANLVAFLASDQASYITGAALAVDGGMII